MSTKCLQVTAHSVPAALQKRAASAAMHHSTAIPRLLQQLRNITPDPHIIANFRSSLEAHFAMLAPEDLSKYRLEQALDVSNALLQKQPETENYNEKYDQPADLYTAVRRKLVLMESWNSKIKLDALKEVVRQVKYMKMLKTQMRRRRKAHKEAQLDVKLPLKLRLKLENKQEFNQVKRKITFPEDATNSPKKAKMAENHNEIKAHAAPLKQVAKSVQPIQKIVTYRPIRPIEEVIEAPVVEDGSSYLKPTPKPKRPKNSPPTPMPDFIRTLSTSGNDMIVIGPNGTTVSRSAFATLNWSLSGTAIARKLLVELFDRQTLAFCSLTGKPSPAFLDMNKPKKEPLDAKKVEDLTYLLTEMLNMTRHEVRIAITTKCADENKMYRQRLKKRQDMEAQLRNSKAMTVLRQLTEPEQQALDSPPATPDSVQPTD